MKISKVRIILDTYNTIIVGKVFVELDKVDSTNNYASELLQKGKVTEGTVIMAHEQYQGRGQRGNSWESKSNKNITISVILHPQKLLAYQQFRLNQSIAIGCQQFLTALAGNGFKIKWPNDLYHKDKKIGGILIENMVSGNYLATSIVGIGININQTRFSSHLPNPTSLQLITKKKHIIGPLVKQLCHFLNQSYLLFRHQPFTTLQHQYLQHLYRYQEFHPYETNNGIIEAQIVDILPSGQLVLETKDSQRSTYFFKEVTFL